LEKYFSIGLHDVFGFNPLMIVFAILLLALSIYLFYLAKKNRELAAELYPSGKKPKQADNFYSKKQECISTLEKIESDFKAGNITKRDAYLKMSLVVREFVFAATGLRLQEMTYTDICMINTKQTRKAADLIRDYYEPEFAKLSDADAIASIQKTKNEILYWTQN